MVKKVRAGYYEYKGFDVVLQDARVGATPMHEYFNKWVITTPTGLVIDAGFALAHDAFDAIEDVYLPVYMDVEK